MIDMDALERHFAENPFHMTPSEELEAVVEYELGDLRCQLEATELLDEWWRNDLMGCPTPLELQRAQADFFFMKWDFYNAEGQPWRPAGSEEVQ